MTGHPLYLHLIMGTALFAAVFGVAAGVQTAPTSAEASVVPLYCARAPQEVALGARAAYALDLASGRILYEKNANAQLPLASLTKVMTVATAGVHLEEGREAIITRDALSPEGDAGLFENERWRVGDLMDFTLMTSANDGARALALAAAAAAGHDLAWFVSEMNSKAASLGLAQTFFLNETGLDVSSTTAGAYGSAKDVAVMLWSAAEEEPRITSAANTARVFVSESGKTHKAENTTAAPALIAGTIATKTGFTDLAGGNLAIIFEPMPGRPVAAAILGTERATRDDDMRTLAAAATEELKRLIACTPYAR